MSTKIHLLPALLVFLIHGILPAQRTTQWGTLPVANLNVKLADSWELNAKWETRQLYYTAVDGENLGQKFDFLLSDQAIVLAHKVGLNSKVAGGYLLRFRGTEVVHRSLQQFSIVQRLREFRLAHRLATDQTYFRNDPLEFRLRYRLSTEFAFNGQAVDPKEWYFKLNNEYLASWQGTNFDLEVRIIPTLGYRFTQKQRLECGLDFRQDSFLDGGPGRHRWWGVVAWYHKV